MTENAYSAKVNTVLIASGGGTDADSIMKAYRWGWIPNIDLKALISTKASAGCLEKATFLGIQPILVEKKGRSVSDFNDDLFHALKKFQPDLIFLVGCIVKVFPFTGVKIYNIHPADPEKHGGIGMYGLEVHRRVLREIHDRIKRGKAKVCDQFFTTPTVHEIIMEYDSGAIFTQTRVEVPSRIILKMLEEGVDGENFETAAKQLQEHVLPYEWLMLPAAVKMAAYKIIQERE